MANTKTILGFIAGISIGAIAGILLSPDKGSATRKKILNKGGDLGNSLKDFLANIVKHTKKANQSLKEEPEPNRNMSLNTMG